MNYDWPGNVPNWKHRRAGRIVSRGDTLEIDAKCSPAAGGCGFAGWPIIVCRSRAAGDPGRPPAL